MRVFMDAGMHVCMNYHICMFACLHVFVFSCACILAGTSYVPYVHLKHAQTHARKCTLVYICISYHIYSNNNNPVTLFTYVRGCPLRK